MRALGKVENNLKEELITDFHIASISDADKQILEYVEKLTINPSAITREDIQKLLDRGFSQSAVHDIAQVAAYFNYVNRIADSLGVELEE